MEDQIIFGKSFYNIRIDILYYLVNFITVLIKTNFKIYCSKYKFDYIIEYYNIIMCLSIRDNLTLKDSIFKTYQTSLQELNRISKQLKFDSLISIYRNKKKYRNNN